MIFLPADESSTMSAILALRVILDPLLKGALLLLLTYGAVRLLRRGPASLRSALWTFALAGLLVLPATVFFQPKLTAPLLTVRTIQTTDSVQSDSTRPAASESVPGIETPIAYSPETGSPENTSSSPALPRWWALVATFWLGGATALLIRTSIRLLQSHRALRHVWPAVDPRLSAIMQKVLRAEGGRSVVLMVTDRYLVPFVTGLRRPRLVLPLAALDWEDEDLESVLRHELAHVRRLDLLRMLLADLACALHWPNPLVWRAAREATLAHEIACDDHVAGGGLDSRRYARLLLSMAAQVTVNRHAAPIPGLARISGIELRLREVLSPRKSGGRRRPRSWLLRRTAALAVAAVLSLPLLTGSVVRIVSDPTDPHFSENPETSLLAPVDLFPIRPETNNRKEAPARPDETQETKKRLERRDSRGMTPLAGAAWDGDTRLLRSLLDRGADPDARNANGLTPLFSALDRGRSELADILADGGADLTVTGYRNWTLLHAAARSGNRSFVRRLLDAGLDPNARSTIGRTALHFARRAGHDGIVEDLLAAGARDIPNPVPWRIYGKKLLDRR